MLEHSLDFDAARAPDVLAGLPQAPAVFSLGFGERREPYVARTSNLRRRLERMLAPEGALSRRLQLLPYVRTVAWSPYGSEFAAALTLYRALSSIYDAAGVRKRMRLRPPAFLRMATENEFPRLFVTTRYVRSAEDRSFGPFPSRAAAERTCDTVLDLFQLRRCVEDLAPYPEHPACLYYEMKKCLAPCNQTVTPERHRAEAEAVFACLRTRGASLLAALDTERAAASEALEFERAAAVHQRYEKAAAALAELPEAMRLLSELSAVVVQPAAEPGQVALFRLTSRGLGGPAPYVTLGMRLHNEQSGSSSLFSHPVALAPVPLDAPAGASVADTLEERLDTSLQALEAAMPARPLTQQTEDALALFARWAFRPVVKRTGEVIFAEADGTLPRKLLLRAISRVARAAALPEAGPAPR